MYAYADGITVMILDISEVEMVGSILEEYESVAQAKINAEKSVDLQLGT